MTQAVNQMLGLLLLLFVFADSGLLLYLILPERSDTVPTVMLPDPLGQAFGDAISAKADADTKTATKATTGNALAQAQAADTQAAADLAAATDLLAAKRKSLEQAIENFFQTGSSPTPPAAPPTP